MAGKKAKRHSRKGRRRPKDFSKMDFSKIAPLVGLIILVLVAYLLFSDAGYRPERISCGSIDPEGDPSRCSAGACDGSSVCKYDRINDVCTCAYPSGGEWKKGEPVAEPLKNHEPFIPAIAEIGLFDSFFQACSDDLADSWNTIRSNERLANFEPADLVHSAQVEVDSSNRIHIVTVENIKVMGKTRAALIYSTYDPSNCNTLSEFIRFKDIQTFPGAMIEIDPKLHVTDDGGIYVVWRESEKDERDTYTARIVVARKSDVWEIKKLEETQHPSVDPDCGYWWCTQYVCTVLKSEPVVSKHGDGLAVAWTQTSGFWNSTKCEKTVTNDVYLLGSGSPQRQPQEDVQASDLDVESSSKKKYVSYLKETESSEHTDSSGEPMKYKAVALFDGETEIAISPAEEMCEGTPQTAVKESAVSVFFRCYTNWFGSRVDSEGNVIPKDTHYYLYESGLLSDLTETINEHGSDIQWLVYDSGGMLRLYYTKAADAAFGVSPHYLYRKGTGQWADAELKQTDFFSEPELSFDRKSGTERLHIITNRVGRSPAAEFVHWFWKQAV